MRLAFSTARSTLPIVVVSISVSLMAMALAIQRAPQHPDNLNTFSSYTGSWSHYMQMRQEWRPRVLSNTLAALLGGLAVHLASTTDGQLAATIGIWTFAWFMFICMLFWSFPQDRVLFYLFGSFCGLAFGYMPGYDTRAYPWDLPSMAVFALFIVLRERSRQTALMIAIPSAMVLKETAAILCVAFLFSSESWRQRGRRFVLTALACVVVKSVVDVLVGAPIPFFSMTTSDPGSPLRLIHNLSTLVSFPRPTFTNPFLVNGGTFAAFLLVSGQGQEIRMLKTIAVLFCVGLFLYAQIEEYRVWFEMIPLSLYGLDLSLRGPLRRSVGAL